MDQCRIIMYDILRFVSGIFLYLRKKTVNRRIGESLARNQERGTVRHHSGDRRYIIDTLVKYM